MSEPTKDVLASALAATHSPPDPTPTASSSVAESPVAPKSTGAKDKPCPFCGQPFTSSSLGRHLDLYIKPKNPKPPDGVHNVETIRRMRENITRRQPRNSLANRDRDDSNPATPSSSSRRTPVPNHVGSIKPPAIPKEGQYVVDHPALYPFQPSWEATGVINDIPPNGGTTGSGSRSGRVWGNLHPGPSPAPEPSTRAQNPPRTLNRAAQKLQLNEKQRLDDAIDTARAAELALRELLSSMRAAKQHVDMNSLPFDFDPLALDFPALTLQCLHHPPTLFSSTPHPTSTSWSIQPPGRKQYDALLMYFQDEFRKWRVACATATTISSEDLTYPPTETHLPHDMHEGVKRAEKAAALLERQVNEHLQSTYQVWEQLPAERRSELWVLELARSLGRRQKELEKLKEAQYATNQQNANLKIQIEQLNRLQQPREFRIQPPATIPIEETFMNYLLSLGVRGVKGVGVTLDERHVDLNTMVSLAIDRWKAVIVSGKNAGMGLQKQLDQATPTATATPITATPAPMSVPMHVPMTTHIPSQRGSRTQPYVPQTSLVVSTPMSTGSSTATEAPSGGEEENSDQDADAEMDEDNFTPTVATMANTPTHIQPQLEISQTGSHNQRATNNQNTPFSINRNYGNHRKPGHQRPTARNPNLVSAMMGQQQSQQQHVNGGDYTSANQEANRGDPMFMD